MMPLAPMVQELGCDEDKANDQFPTDELRSFTSSQFRFSISVYISRSWSEPTGTDMIDQHCTIILASGSLRNVFTCRNINNNNKTLTEPQYLTITEAKLPNHETFFDCLFSRF